MSTAVSLLGNRLKYKAVTMSRHDGKHLSSGEQECDFHDMALISSQ
jgi:hypothetical protein